MKKMPEDWRELNNLFGLVDAVKKSQPETTKSGFELVCDKISERCMTAHDLRSVLGISYRMILDWERRKIRFADRRSKKKHSWRLFSIEDLFSFAILLALKHLNIPVSSNHRLLETIRSSLIAESILIPYTQGKKAFLYHDNETIAGFYIEGRTNKFDQEILTAIKPMVFMPLNNILSFVLERAGRKDFHVDIDKNTNKITFFVDGNPVELSDRVPINTKPDLDKNNK